MAGVFPANKTSFIIQVITKLVAAYN